MGSAASPLHSYIILRLTSLVLISHACERVHKHNPLGLDIAITSSNLYVLLLISLQGSHTGYIIFINRAPILWFSKRQNTVETSAFSSEMIAIKTCMEAIQALRYKLKMFGVPLMGPTEVFCDNNSLVLNTSNVESKLNRKHNSLAFHAIRWSVAAEIMRVAWIDGRENISDAMTKILSKEDKEYLFGNGPTDHS